MWTFCGFERGNRPLPSRRKSFGFNHSNSLFWHKFVGKLNVLVAGYFFALCPRKAFEQFLSGRGLCADRAMICENPTSSPDLPGLGAGIDGGFDAANITLGKDGE